MHQIGEVGVGTYSSVVTLMTGSWGDFTLSFNMFPTRIPRGEGDDTPIWQLTHCGVFDVCFFNYSLLKAPSVSLPWQSIWCINVPKSMSFFL